MKIILSLQKVIFCFSILIFFSTNNVLAQANNYYCYIENIRLTSTSTIEFDVRIEWTGSNTQKLTLFQAGINFNYAGLANGGTITGAFKPGSADPLLPGAQHAPNWNINQSSKQIRMLAAIVAPSTNAISIPGPPGFRLGTFVITNTVPFSLSSSPNFAWSFATGTATTSITQISAYINGATTGTNITIPSNHFIFTSPCILAPCPETNAGGPYSSCGDVHLNGNTNTGNAIWTSSGTGTFAPNTNTMNAIYHPSPADLAIGNVTLTLKAEGWMQLGCPGCADAISTATVTFTSIKDNDICTTDGCDQVSGLPTHSAPQCITFNSSIFIQGFYSGNGMMDNSGAGGFLFITGIPGAQPNDADTIEISVMQANSPWSEVERQKVVLKTDGNVSATFSSNVIAGNSYYVRIKHLGSIETWSSVPVVFNSVTNYSFSSSASQTFQNNVVPTFDNLYYAIIRGDVNSDCAIDGSDFLQMGVAINDGSGGYTPLDFNGDGAVDGADFLLLDINIQLGYGCP